MSKQTKSLPDNLRPVLEQIVLEFQNRKNKARFEMDVAKSARDFYISTYSHKRLMSKEYDKIYRWIKELYDKSFEVNEDG